MKQLVPALFGVGAVMALTGAAVFITGWIYAPYIYTIGAGFIALAQVNTPVKGKSKTLKRLRVQQIFGALALILTGAFMFTTRGNEWIACLPKCPKFPNPFIIPLHLLFQISLSNTLHIPKNILSVRTEGELRCRFYLLYIARDGSL